MLFKWLWKLEEALKNLIVGAVKHDAVSGGSFEVFDNMLGGFDVARGR